MKVLTQKIALVFFKLLRTFLLKISEKNKVKIGKVIGQFMMIISPKRKRITLKNIKKSSLNLSLNRYNEIVRGSYENLGITLVELLTIDSYDFHQTNPKIEFKNIELILDAQSRGNGVILLSGHFGNWELLAYSVGVLLNTAIHIVIKYQMNPYTDKYLRNLRQRSGNQLIDMHKAGSTIVKMLKNNGIIAMLADQRAGKNEGLTLDFLGRPASTYKAPATLALKLNSPIIIGYPIRDENNNYKITLQEIDHSDLDDNQEGIETLTKRYLESLERAIIDNPTLWAWQHNRWKID